LTKAKDWKYWLRTLGYPEKQRAPRRKPIGLVAMYGNHSAPKQVSVKTLSVTGLYLETADRWPLDEVISLTLQKDGMSGSDSELHLNVQVRVASYGEDGVGFEFKLPKGFSTDLWEHLIDNADVPNESEESKFILRMVRAILFLYRLSPSTAAEPIQVLTGELDQFRTGNMLSIALIAERMLAAQPDSEQLRAHPGLVSSILKDGSWADDELVRHLWAGLLASSCNPEGTDESNKDFAELLVQVTKSQAHILVESCRRAMEPSDPERSDGLPGSPMVITPEEMIRITGTYDLYRSATDVAYLHSYGLMEKGFDFSTHTPKTSFDITPSRLGMQLFKVCRGQMFAHVNVLS